jgi:mRNA interferase RelE/StbE
MNYKIELKPAAKKQLKKINSKNQEKILDKIYLLSENPYPQNSKSLKARDDRSMRVGNYRVIYDVYENKLVILVLKVGDRKDVYKK